MFCVLLCLYCFFCFLFIYPDFTLYFPLAYAFSELFYFIVKTVFFKCCTIWTIVITNNMKSKNQTNHPASLSRIFKAIVRHFGKYTYLLSYRDLGKRINLKIECGICCTDCKILGVNKTDLTCLSYLHTLTCFELRSLWRLLFLQVQDRPHKTSDPPHPDTFQLDTPHTFPDPHRSKSQHCSSLTERWGMTQR